MPIFLDTRGKSTLGIGICGRCSRKFPLDELYSDPNTGSGLRVCIVDRDDYDPWRLPARSPDQIALRFTRPDVSIAAEPSGLISEDGEGFLITPDEDEYLIP